jgi:hypothetical protein
MTNKVMVGRTSVENSIKNWVEEMDNETLERLFNQNFDKPIKTLGDGYFHIDKEEAERNGMVIIETLHPLDF